MMNMQKEMGKMINKFNTGFVEDQAIDFIKTLDEVKDLLGEIPQEMIDEFEGKSSVWLASDISEATKGLIDETLTRIC